jgi:hypothetical protein
MMQYLRRHLDDRQVQRRWVDPRLPDLRLDQIRAYLLGKGWKEVAPDRPGVLVFEEPALGEEGPLHQWVPDSEQRREYLQGVYELLAAVAEVEDRSAGEVLTDMLEASPANGESPNSAQTGRGESVRPGGA